MCTFEGVEHGKKKEGITPPLFNINNGHASHDSVIRLCLPAKLIALQDGFTINVYDNAFQWTYYTLIFQEIGYIS